MRSIDKIHGCKARYEADHCNPAKAPIEKRITSSEVFAGDDLERGEFKGFDNKNRPKSEVQEWAKNTEDLARKSSFFHFLEIPLKVLSYTANNFDSEGMTSKGLFALERLSESLGSMFRYKIYGQKGDNLDAEAYAAERYGDKASSTLGKVNHFIQTKLRFIFPIIGLVNRDLGNDLDWFVSNTIESTWLRNSTFNTGFYSGFSQEIGKKIVNSIPGLRKSTTDSSSQEDQEIGLSWQYIKDKVKDHYEQSKKLYKDMKSHEKGSEERDKSTLSFTREMDNLTSILGLIQIPMNVLGDTFRPIARRMELTGPIRVLTRVLSVADRGMLGANYIFRFLIPTMQQERQQGVNGIFRASNMYIASLVGDIVDIPLTAFDSQLKEAPGIINHGAALFRIVKNSAFNLFWSQKRIQNASGVIQATSDK